MPNSEDITVWFEAEKLRALREALAQTGSNVEQELTKALEALYERSVPLRQRTEIACKLAEERRCIQEEQEKQAAEKYRVSVVCVIDSGAEHCWKLERHWNVLSIAALLRKAIRQSGKQIASDFEQLLGEKEAITPDEASQFATARFQGDVHVSGVFFVDFGEQVFTFIEPGEHPYQYHIQDISTAIFRASRKQYISEGEKMSRFWNALENKRIERRS